MLAYALVCVLAVSALTAATPVILKVIVDQLSHGTLKDPYFNVGVLVAAYAAAQWLSRSVGELQLLAIGRANERLHRRLSVRLFEHLMSLPLRFHIDRRTGALNQTLANGLLGYRLLIQHLVSTVMPVLLQLAMMGTVLLLLSQSVFLWIIVASLLCYAILFSIGAAKLTTSARAVSAANIDANAFLTDGILNFEAIKCFCAEQRVRHRIEATFTQTEKLWGQFFSRKATNGVLAATIFTLSLGMSVSVAAGEVQQGSMSLGEFVLVNAYMLQIVRPLEMIGLACRDIAQGAAFLEKMTCVLGQTPEPALRAVRKPLPPGPGEVIFDNVCFSYNQQRLILDNVSFRVTAGKTVAVVGASGSGKSSLIRLLLRFWEPDSGRILLDGYPISEISASSLRAAIAVVPQDTVLFNDTIANNIRIGRVNSSTEEVLRAARVAHIHDSIVTRLGGYETLVGERGLKLSAGEKQRIAIARAALKEPRILVFDEATSSLDTKSEQQILSNLREVAQGTTTLVIAHRLSTIVQADFILVLEDGRILDCGTHEDLLRHSSVYRSMWVAQHAGAACRHSSSVSH